MQQSVQSPLETGHSALSMATFSQIHQVEGDSRLEYQAKRCNINGQPMAGEISFYIDCQPMAGAVSSTHIHTLIVGNFFLRCSH